MMGIRLNSIYKKVSEKSLRKKWLAAQRDSLHDNSTIIKSIGGKHLLLTSIQLFNQV